VREPSLGHVVLKVRDLQRSEAFYDGVSEMSVVTRISDPARMTLFTLGNHHDFGITEVGADAPSRDPGATGLAHVAFKVGDSREDFDAGRSHLDSAGPVPTSPGWAIGGWYPSCGTTVGVVMRRPCNCSTQGVKWTTSRL
jgi:catechol 2,3-dioxygenase-like lactoylglutathione lyase family enzyme